jgi:biopolymer transport protein ExbD
MGMSTGGGGSSLSNEINVTPMIDVLLVLLIIFMMIIPMSRKAIETQLPDPNPQVAPANPNPDQIVLEVLPDDKYAINKEPVETAGCSSASRDLRSAPGEDHLRQGRHDGDATRR